MSTAGVVFRVLGPVEAELAGGRVRLTRRRERGLLAMLVLEAGQPVPVQRLADLLWGDQRPDDVRSALQTCVSRLRAGLAGPAGATGGVRVVRGGADGYAIEVDRECVDAHRFTDLVAAARSVTDAGQRAGLLREALGLWRGPALADVDERLRGVLGARWELLRQSALVARVEADLAVGVSEDLVGELTELAAADPLSEPLAGLLMRALSRLGHRTEALAVFQRIRSRVVERLGMEPGRELQQLHRRILAGGEQPGPGSPMPDRPVTLRRYPAVTVGPVPVPVPRQLPAPPAAFTGRAIELAWLDTERASAGPAGPVAISAITGTAGVGKTALAIHWAHAVRDRFPDGQLYLNLRGYDSAQPVAAADALARLLTGLGLPSQDVPADPDERAARYRSELSGRRMLIILDNAAAVAQVRPLLPGGGSSMVVVTSRDRLAGLVALQGARRLELNLLPPSEAAALLRRLLGPRIDAEREAAATLADQCARLPLALRVAAELAASRPGVSLRELVVELADQRRRLELLDGGGDPYAAVRVVFSWSVRQLPARAAGTFRLLGLHPGPDFAPDSAAALAGIGHEQARHTLELLARAYLLHPTSSGRYGMHDLLRAYAAQLAGTDDPASQRRAARERLFDYYLAAAAVAMDRWHPAGSHRRPRIPPPATTPLPDLADSDAARAWLDGERACLVAIAADAATHGWPAHAIQLSVTLAPYLDAGHFVDAQAVHGAANGAAEHAGDLAGQAHALHYLTVTNWRMGKSDGAPERLQRALDLYRRAGDLAGEALVLTMLGSVEDSQGSYQLAVDYNNQALARFRQAGDQLGETQALCNLGVFEGRRGRYRPAAEHLQRALRVGQQSGGRRDQATVLTNLGIVEGRMGRHRSAADHLQQALALFREFGNRWGEAHALENLGVLYLQRGQQERAGEQFEQALTVSREVGDQAGEARALNGLGEAALAAGLPSEALARHADARAIAIDIVAQEEQARAHAGLGHAHDALGDAAGARTHYELALGLYRDLGMAEADEVRSRLAVGSG